MALVTFEGFDQFDSSAMTAQLLSKGWAAVSFNQTTAGRLSGRAMLQSSNQNVRWDFAAPIATATVGCAFQLTLTNSGARDLFCFTDGGSTMQFGLGINTSNKLFVWRGSVSTVVATSTTGLTPLQWYFLEMQATIHNTTGAYEVRLGGTQIADLTATGVNTRSTANNQMTGVMIGSSNSPTGNFYYDDVYITDTSGSSNAGFIGEIRVQTIVPTGAGSSTQWTPSTGANWAAVDEIGTSGSAADTDYVSSSTAGQVDLYATGGSAISGNPAVYAVGVSATARKDDVGTRTLRTRLKSGSSTANGATQTLLSSYATYRTVHLTDPATGAAWTPAAVNSAEIGVELVS